ncbi:MAG: methyltransferase domain-containing protein, partial [bacterium]|nr:methyltransferase domain-containing protein [bacterium]
MNAGLHRRLIVVVGAVVVLAVALIFARRLRLDEDLTALLPADDPIVRDHQLVMERFHKLDRIYVDVGGPAEARADIEAVADALYERFEDSGRFEQIRYRMSMEGMQTVLEQFSLGKGRLLSAQDVDRMADRMTPEGMARQLAAAQRELMQPSGPFAVDRIQRDPLGLDELLTERFEQLQQAGGGAQVIDGRLWNHDATHLIMVLSPGFPAVNAERSRDLVAVLNDVRDGIEQDLPKPDVTISFTGGHISMLDNATTIRGDIQRSVLIISVGIVVLGICFFRHRLYVALIFVPAGFGMACSAGILGLFDPAVSGIALGCGTALIGVTVDYGIHVLYRLDNAKARVSPVACVRALWLPILTGAATTAAAFLCLLFSSLPGQREMGVFASMGVAFAAAFTFFVLPFITPAPRGSARPLVPFSKLCGVFLSWQSRHLWKLAILSLGMVAASLYGLTMVKLDADVSRMSALSGRNRVDESTFLTVWGYLAPALIVVHAPDGEAALQANDAIHDELRAIREEGVALTVGSVAPILPSLATQTRNLAAWRDRWAPLDVRQRLTDVAEPLGFAPDAFEPFVALVETDPEPITSETLAGTAFDELLANHIASDGDETYVMTSLWLEDREQLAGVADRVRGVVPGVVIVDKRQFAQRTAALLLGDLKRLALLAAMTVLVCLALTLGSLELVLAAFMPLALSVVVALGLLGLFGVAINMVSSIFIIFVFGVGVDFSVFLLANARDMYMGRSESAEDTVGSVAMCALTTLCGFTGLALARHPGISSVGITGLIGIGSCLAMSLLTVPVFAGILFPPSDNNEKITLKTFLGAMWAAVYLGPIMAIYRFGIRYVLMVVWRGDVARRQRFARRYMHLMAVGLLRFFPYRHSGCHFVNVRPEGFRKAGVIVSNHQSSFDIMVILSLPADLVMVVKDWVWNCPVMGVTVQDAGYILAGSMSAEDLIAECTRLIDSGVSVFLFPEGTRTPDGLVRRYHKGAFEVAIQADADIVPVVLSNTRTCLPRGTFLIGDFRAVIRALPRVTSETADYTLGARALAQHVRRLTEGYALDDWRLAQRSRVFWLNLRRQYKYLGTFVEPYVTWKLRLDPVYRGLDALVPEHGHILDIGCGVGIASNLLANRSITRTVHGIDSDEAKIHVAKVSARGRPSVTLETADALSADLPRADAVLLIDVLHYWTPENQRRLIERACAALAPGGVLVFR